MKHSKLFRDINRNNANIEKENRERLRALYDKYLERRELESEVNEDAKAEKK